MKKTANTTAQPAPLQTDPRRRALILFGLLSGAGLFGLREARAEALTETDPTAQALGYKADAGQVDAAKFPQRLATQHCSNCNFFQAAAGDSGGCQLFPGKSVSAKGWCSAYVVKA